MDFYEKKRLEERCKDLMLRNPSITLDIVEQLKKVLATKEPKIANDFIYGLMLKNDKELESILNKLGINKTSKSNSPKLASKTFTLTQNKKAGYISALQLALISGLIGGSFMLGIINLVK